jgi:hypothetical protein
MNVRVNKTGYDPFPGRIDDFRPGGKPPEGLRSGLADRDDPPFRDHQEGFRPRWRTRPVDQRGSLDRQRSRKQERLHDEARRGLSRLAGREQILRFAQDDSE